MLLLQVWAAFPLLETPPNYCGRTCSRASLASLPSSYTSRIASEIREFDATGIYSTRDQSRFSRCIQYAVYSAFQALRQAGIAPENENPERCGVIIGSSIGGLQYCYDAAVALSTRGPSRVSPFYIPMAIVNMPAGEVCNKTGWMGPSYTVTSACATSNHSIANAYDMIRLPTKR